MVMSFRRNPTGVMLAICEMIGQMEDMNLTVKTGDVAAWCNVTKATAKTYLEKMEKVGMVVRDVATWRGKAKVHYWYLSEKTITARSSFQVFRQSYNEFRNSRTGAWS